MKNIILNCITSISIFIEKNITLYGSIFGVLKLYEFLLQYSLENRSKGFSIISLSTDGTNDNELWKRRIEKKTIPRKKLLIGRCLRTT